MDHNAACAHACDEPSHISSLPAGVLSAILSFLQPRDLCRVSQVCLLWRLLATSDNERVWGRFYRQRWAVPAGSDHNTSSLRWNNRYSGKMTSLKAWAGRYEQDNLHGHRAGVRCLKLLPSHNLAVTGSLDKTVRLWDLKAGMPLSVSKPHGGTVRCISVDSTMLVSGCTDHSLRVWMAVHAQTNVSSRDSASTLREAGLRLGVSSLSSHTGVSNSGPQAKRLNPGMDAAGDGFGSQKAEHPGTNISHGSNTVGNSDNLLFDLTTPGMILTGHTGPVTSLCLTGPLLYSGSWDHSVRCWSRGEGMKCTNVLTYDDWVYCIAARGPNLLVSTGSAVIVHDIATGQATRTFKSEGGHVNALEGTLNGRMLYTGSEDGVVLSRDLRMKESAFVLWHHNASVTGLAFEDPWLSTSSADGSLILLNTETQRKAGSARCLGPHCRQLMSPGGPATCIDMKDQWLACGARSATVRVWDFTKAADALERAATARSSRNSRAIARALPRPAPPPQSPDPSSSDPEDSATNRMWETASGHRLPGVWDPVVRPLLRLEGGGGRLPDPGLGAASKGDCIPHADQRTTLTASTQHRQLTLGPVAAGDAPWVPHPPSPYPPSHLQSWLPTQVHTAPVSSQPQSMHNCIESLAIQEGSGQYRHMQHLQQVSRPRCGLPVQHVPHQKHPPQQPAAHTNHHSMQWQMPPERQQQLQPHPLASSPWRTIHSASVGSSSGSSREAAWTAGQSSKTSPPSPRMLVLEKRQSGPRPQSAFNGTSERPHCAQTHPQAIQPSLHPASCASSTNRAADIHTRSPTTSAGLQGLTAHGVSPVGGTSSLGVTAAQLSHPAGTVTGFRYADRVQKTQRMQTPQPLPPKL